MNEEPMKSDVYRALLVDSDSLLLRVLAMHLHEAGYEVETTSDPHVALEGVRSNCPDFLITDWDMPAMNGVDLCRRVRSLESCRYVYVVFLSRRDSPEDLVQALDAGADEYLLKPVQESVLLARMQAGKRVLKLENRLAELASLDELTGLPSRRVLDEFLVAEWPRSQRHRTPLSCVMVDLDHFKHVNDTYGHKAGDTVLKIVSDTLKKLAREGDVVCRYGGEEFCALLPNTCEADAAAWAGLVLSTIRQLEVAAGGQRLKVAASFGVAEMLAEMEDWHDLIDLADQSLLAAKRMGRDRVVQFSRLNSDACSTNQEASDVLARVVAKDAMTAIIAPLERSTTLRQAAELFLEFRVSAAPVVDSTGRLVGIVTEKDMIGALEMPGSSQRQVGEVMRTNVIAYDEQTPLRRIYDFVCRGSIRSVVVVNKDEHPTGIIGRHTILRWFLNYVWRPSEGDRRGKWAPEQGDRSLGDPLDACEQLALQARELRDSMASSTADEWSIPVIAGASRMQELLNDLLSSSGYSSAKSFW